MKQTIWVLIALVSVNSAVCRELSLQQALVLAEKHSHSLKKARMESGAAGESLSAARAERYPSFSVIASASYISDIPTLDIEVPPMQPISREMGTKENYQADLQLSVPLFTGGRISTGIYIAQASQSYRHALERGSIDLVRYRTTTEYLELLRSFRLLEAAEASLRRAELIDNDIRSMYQAGTADSVDILETRLALTRAQFVRERALISGRSSEIRLLTLLGLTPSDHLDLTIELEEPALAAISLHVFDNKSDIEAAKAAVAVSRWRLDLESAEYLPSISGYVGYSYGKPNLDRFNNEWNDYFTVGARAAWTLNLFKAGSRRAKASYDLDASVHNEAMVRESLERDARLAYEQRKLAFESYLSAKREFEIASDNYRLVTEMHREGSLSTNRLLETEATLTAAQSNLAAAAVDFHIARTYYVYVTDPEKLKEGI